MAEELLSVVWTGAPLRCSHMTTMSPSPRRGALADWLFPPYLTHWWVNSSVTSESELRGVWILCVYSVCGGGDNTVRRRWIESRFIHHCDSWSRSNTTFQVTSWLHFWRMSCEGSFDWVTRRGGGPLRIPIRTRNTHVCPQTPIWLWNIQNWYRIRSKIWSLLVYFVFFFTHTTRPTDTYILRQRIFFFFFKSRPFLWVDLRRGWMPFPLGSLFFVVKKGKLVIGQHLTVPPRGTLLWL